MNKNVRQQRNLNKTRHYGKHSGSYLSKKDRTYKKKKIFDGDLNWEDFWKDDE